MSVESKTLRMTDEHTPNGDTTLTADDTDAGETAAPKPAMSKRRMESRRRIMAAARQLFVEKGYHATRPQDISKLAGVGHGTFYLHFSDKLECFLAFAAEASDELSAFIGEHTEEQTGPEEGLRESLIAIFDYSEANPGVLAAALTDVSVLATSEIDVKLPTDRWAEEYARVVQEWSAAGTLQTDLEPLFAGYVILGIIRQTGIYAFRTGATKEDMARDLAKVIVRSLKPSK